MSDTKENILDAAERLFAQKGIEETSLRALTNEAGANLGAIHYYFGSKEALLGEVVARRLEDYQEKRRVELGKLLDRESRPTLEEVLRVFIGGVSRYRQEHPHFIKLMGRVLIGSHDELKNVCQGVSAEDFDWFFPHIVSGFFPNEKHEAVIKRLVVWVTMYFSLTANYSLLEDQLETYQIRLDDEGLTDLLVEMMSSALRGAN